MIWLDKFICLDCSCVNVKCVPVVYATMRNLSKGEALVEAAGRTLGRTLEIKQLDVCDEESIKTCVDSLPERRVDILSKFRAADKQ